jgi:hypothetical protein
MLVLFVSGSTGAVAVLGSVLGASVNHTGLFVGALFGGLIGVWVAVRLSKTLRFIEANEVRAGILGGGIGFLLAAPVAAANAHTPVIPVLSAGLVGLGALVSVIVSGKISSK